MTENLKKDSIISRKNIIPLRPALSNYIPANNIDQIIGKKLIRNLLKDEPLSWNDIY